NLVVVSGTDPFAEGARVRDVFVEGVRYAIPEPEQREQRGQRAGAGTVVTGDFVGELDSPAGLLRITLTITGSGDNLRGRITSEMGNVELTGRQDGSDITLSGTFA